MRATTDATLLATVLSFSLGAALSADRSAGALPEASVTIPALLGLFGLALAGNRWRLVPSGHPAAFSMRRTLVPAGATALLALLLLLPTVARSAPITSLVISEVLYNPTGLDDGREWVEIYNGSVTAIDLSTYSLGWGGPDYTYGTAQLSGTILPGQYFVIGGPVSDANNANPTYDLALDLGPNLQDALVFVADGVALFDVPAAAVTPATVPIDAVLYGWPGAVNLSGLMDETGAPAAVDVFTFVPGDSVELTDTGWVVQGTPAPGAGPLVTPDAATGAYLLFGLTLLGVGRRQTLASRGRASPRP